jgi:tetratricopeptide (TPR) repeat protein
MTRRRICLSLVSLVLMLISIAAAQSSSGNAELVLGVQAFKQARYEEAIFHFERAVQNEPSNINARLYLATTFAQQYIPGADTPDNIAMGNRAIEQYKHVVDLDSSQINAVKGLAYLHLQMKKFDEAREFYRRATELDPLDPEGYYSIGVIDWMQTYQPRQGLRATLNLTPDRPLIKHSECWQVRDANRERVADGIEMLTKALELRPDYDDAMAYMNLMYRERADIQCFDEKANVADLDTADKWVDRTMAVKKAKAEEAQRVERQLHPSSDDPPK